MADEKQQAFELLEKLNLLCAGHPMGVSLRAQQDLFAASICLIGTLDESLAFVDAVASDIKATVRTHHAWYNSVAGQVSSPNTPQALA